MVSLNHLTRQRCRWSRAVKPDQGSECRLVGLPCVFKRYLLPFEASLLGCTSTRCVVLCLMSTANILSRHIPSHGDMECGWGRGKGRDIAERSERPRRQIKSCRFSVAKCHRERIKPEQWRQSCSVQSVSSVRL